MNPLLLVFLLECVLGSPPDPDAACTPACALEAAYSRQEPQEKVPAGYTLRASCSGSCAYRWVQFVGTGYYPPSDLGTYQVCVEGERVLWRSGNDEREVIQTTPWSQSRSIGFVGSDGGVRFSQFINPETSSVCIVLTRSFSAATVRVPGSQSRLGVPVTAWPPRRGALACVLFRVDY